MKKIEYEEPQLELFSFDGQDVIRTSLGDNDDEFGNENW